MEISCSHSPLVLLYFFADRQDIISKVLLWQDVKANFLKILRLFLKAIFTTIFFLEKSILLR